MITHNVILTGLDVYRFVSEPARNLRQLPPSSQWPCPVAESRKQRVGQPTALAANLEVCAFKGERPLVLSSVPIQTVTAGPLFCNTVISKHRIEHRSNSLPFVSQLTIKMCTSCIHALQEGTVRVNMTGLMSKYYHAQGENIETS
jgi:hypothetical protein